VPALLEINRNLVPGKPHFGVWQHRQKNGRSIDVEVVAHAFLMAGKQANLVLVKDITEIKRLEADRIKAQTHLRDAHQSILTIWESITEAYVTLDRDWRLIYTNSTATQMLCQLTNLEANKILGKTHWEIFPWTVGTIVDREYRRAVAEQVAVHFEVFYEPTVNWFEIHAYPSEIGLGVYFRDITDRKTAETQLHQTEAKLRHLLSSNPAILYA
jgi:PAS domain-containing protein